MSLEALSVRFKRRFMKRKHPSADADGCFSDSTEDLVPNHCGAEETQHLADRIRDRRATTAGERRPTARGFVVTSSTINDPESPLSRNLLPLFEQRFGR